MEKQKNEVVKSKMEWLRSLENGEKKTGFFSTVEEVYSMSVLIARVNALQSAVKGFKIRGHYQPASRLVTIYTETI
ncbi:MAG: hypothetical protein MJZ60_00045 [Bacteroidaceae bacterium]|nr:hypothetical protein [Bacteroidaceae bacterium]